jgi:type II secretory pathway component HofQ
MRTATLVLLAMLVPAPPGTGEENEARVSIDVKDAPVQAIVGVLVELGGRQVVFDSGLDCALTLKVHEVPWLTALDTTLRACGLDREESGGVLFVATMSRLQQEAENRRRLNEAQGENTRPGLTLFRLSYARAEELAPLVRRLVAPEGDVSVDPRTNTLMIRY